MRKELTATSDWLNLHWENQSIKKSKCFLMIEKPKWVNQTRKLLVWKTKIVARGQWLVWVWRESCAKEKLVIYKRRDIVPSTMEEIEILVIRVHKSITANPQTNSFQLQLQLSCGGRLRNPEKSISRSRYRNSRRRSAVYCGSIRWETEWLGLPSVCIWTYSYV